jgi:phosphoglycolate phosphatase
MRPDAIVFDLDGTLVDSAADLAATLNAVLIEHNREPVTLDAVRAMIGDGVGALVHRGFAATGRPLGSGELSTLTGHFLDIYIDPNRDHIAHPYPGVTDTLRIFANLGVRMGVCTNKAQVATDLVLHNAGLSDFFSAVIGHDKAPAPKPDPAHVLCVCAALGHPKSAVMVGDSLNDLLAGHRAGLKVLLTTYGYGTPEALSQANATFDRFDQLPALIASLD